MNHTLRERIKGHHDWVEQNRFSQLFDIVNYVCSTCGEPKERWEHPDRGDLSLDPDIKAEQLERRERERQRAIEEVRRRKER